MAATDRTNPPSSRFSHSLFSSSFSSLSFLLLTTSKSNSTFPNAYANELLYFSSFTNTFPFPRNTGVTRNLNFLSSSKFLNPSLSKHLFAVETSPNTSSKDKSNPFKPFILSPHRFKYIRMCSTSRLIRSSCVEYSHWVVRIAPTMPKMTRFSINGSI